LVPLAVRSRNEPLAFVQNRELFGDLADENRFVRPYLWTLESLRRNGARETLQQLLVENNDPRGV
jgi:mannitol 2-dehydrogenase